MISTDRTEWNEPLPTQAPTPADHLDGSNDVIRGNTDDAQRLSADVAQSPLRLGAHVPRADARDEGGMT